MTEEPQVAQQGALRVYEWELEDVPPVAPEDDLPGSYDPYPFVQISEFAGWGDVARWAVPYYRAPRSPTVEAEAARIRSEQQGEEARFLEALRFVQDDIRYLGIEAGRSAHVPALPATVLERRYGDCKEKALLLVQLLERLDIKAWPALVATDFGPGLGELLPSPWDFDHVIVKAAVGGRTVWADATQSLQRGPLNSRQPPPFGLALVVDPATSSLERIPVPQPGDLLVEEDYTPDGDGAKLILTRTYRGAVADELRRRLAREGRGSVERDLLNDVAATDPDAEPDGAFSLADDPGKDTIRLTSNWKVPALMDGGTQTFYASSLDERLVRPRIALRTMPLSVPWPERIQHVVRAHLPGRFRLQPKGSGKVEGPALRLTWSSRVQKNDVEVEWTLESLHDRVAPDAVRDHLDSIDDIENALSFEVSADDAPAKSAQAGHGPFRTLGILAAGLLGLIGVTGAVVVMAIRRR